MNLTEKNTTKLKELEYPLISVVIPCYKSTKTLPAVAQTIKETMERQSKEYQLSKIDYELILVNDGSPDEGATGAMVKKLAAQDEHIVAVDLARNFGQQAALMAGLNQTKGDIIVCMDDDGQTPPEEMFKLIDKVREGYDLVFASYGKNKQHSFYRRLGSKFNHWCDQRFMGIPEDIEQTSYLACKRFVVESALTYTNPYPFVDGLLFRSVQTYTNVPVNHRPRTEGESGYTLSKLVGLWVNGCTSFSVSPLRAATVAGFVFSLVGFIFTVFIILHKIIDPSINEGWSSLMSVMLFMGGLMMLMMGLLGEYVGRIYLSLNNSPQFVVRDIVDRRQEKYIYESVELTKEEDAVSALSTGVII